MPLILCQQKSAFILKTSLLSKCHPVSEMVIVGQLRTTSVFTLFHYSQEKNDTEDMVVIYYEAKTITVMREKLLTCGGFYILLDFQKGHKY